MKKKLHSTKGISTLVTACFLGLFSFTSNSYGENISTNIASDEVSVYNTSISENLSNALEKYETSERAIMQQSCDAIACTLTADSPLACIGLGDDSVSISATGNDDGNIPDGFEVIYILTFGNGLEIWDISTELPQFDVSVHGDYRIHKLVYDPETFDPFAVIEINVTTGFDVVDLINSEGICANLDVEGARVWVDKPLAGTLTAVESVVPLDNDTAHIAAIPNGDIFIPARFDVGYILTTGPDNTIIKVSNTPSFTVRRTGNYVIRSVVYDAEFLADISSNFQIGVTTLAELSELFISNEYCGTIDLEGAPIEVIEGSCTAQACTMTPTSPLACIGNGDDFTVISATGNDDGNVPDGFSVVYVLTFGNDLVIWDLSTEPIFEVSVEGDYRIHKFVYNPATINPFTAVELYVSTVFECIDLVINIGACADIDIEGARVWVDKPLAGTLTPVEAQVDLDNGSATVAATPNGDISIPSGYTAYYFLVQDNIVIQAGENPSFNVSESGTYSIHTLVYDPEFLMDITSIYDLGTSTVAETIKPFLSEEYCGDFDIIGATITVGLTSCDVSAGTLTANASTVVLDDGTAVISATPNGDAFVPDGYEVRYILSREEALVITTLDVVPTFAVVETGLYTIHSWIYDPETFDLADIDFGSTTAGEIFGLTLEGGGALCASLDIQGAPTNVEDNVQAPCTASPAQLYSPDAISCINNDSYTKLVVKENTAALVPEGFKEAYLVIDAFSDKVYAIFNNKDEINFGNSGLYNVKSLIYNPTTFDMSTIIIENTVSQDLSTRFIENGGMQCGSLDTIGSLHLVLSSYLCEFYYGNTDNDTGISQNNLKDQLGRFSSNEELERYMMNILFPVSMYPNPAKDILNINAAPIEREVMQIEVYDLRGSVVLEKKMELFTPGIQNINVSQFKNGVYIAKFKSKYRVIIRRFVVAN